MAQGLRCRPQVKEASQFAVRDLQTAHGIGVLQTLTKDKIRAITIEDFRKAAKRARKTVDRNVIMQCEKWNEMYGSRPYQEEEDDGEW
ncbi:hypothetical protein CYMTET_25906 [Cymbomonas tetramitiformis]|uniref:Spastin/Vps4 C-terminal domain-containing protein n=1 Tax=Cymbomonas tetramitiformis TaxID=36881 RepID=A0AAE0FT96_9CHLO|nr:hypothetical protein CYMTET_25906 [Cymbomonas tetramitiformis]